MAGEGPLKNPDKTQTGSAEQHILIYNNLQQANRKKTGFH